MNNTIYNLEGQLGELFTINGKDVWKLISFCSQPTACFENIETKQQTGGSIYSPNVVQFKRLIIEKPTPTK